MPCDVINCIETLKPLFNYLQKFGEVSEEEFQQISKFILVRRFGKKEMITQKGEVENYLHFVLKGLVRKYFIKNKEEINTQISYEGHLIHAQESFHSRKASDFNIETLEPAVLASIHYDDLETIYLLSAKMEHIARLVITHTMVLKDCWKMQFIELSAKERLNKFVNHHPELLRRVPQKYLASYLNIKPETFSRLKHPKQT